jgi:hypothetical protein
MLDKEIVPNEDMTWAHDASLTFGRISKSVIVIIYHPTWSDEIPLDSGLIFHFTSSVLVSGREQLLL